MNIKKGFVLREVCGENVIVGEGLEAVNFGRLLALNETAAWLWKQALAMGDFTIDALAEKLCEEYDVTNEVAQKDVAAIVGQWQKEGVVTE
ncbi:MAG: PqqD family protein [Prevotella sp.]|nr:PqqD family protein [Prevotella sp.]MBR1546590.1 PqqD family protein [Prevotella sp.]